MELNNYKNKIKALFDKFTIDNYHLNSYYPLSVLKYFETSQKNSPERKLIESPFFSDLLLRTLANLEIIPCAAIKSFILELVTLMVENELQYFKLVHMYGFHTLIQKMGILKESKRRSTLQLSFIRLPTALISHGPGLAIVMNQKAWIYILTPTTHEETTQVANAAYRFMSQLVWKLNELEEENTLADVLQYIVNPIIHSEYHTGVIDIDNENQRSGAIKPYIHTLLAIFNDTADFMQPNSVVRLLERYLLIHGYLHNILDASRDDDVLSTTAEFLFRYYFATRWNSVRIQVNPENYLFIQIMSIYNNIVKRFLIRKRLPVLMKFLVKCLIFWPTLGEEIISNTVFERDGQKFDLCIQLVLLQIVPILAYAADYNNDKTYDIFCLKIHTLTTEHVARAYYAYRSVIKESDNIKKYCILGLKELLKLKGRLHKAQAGIIFQALYYALESHVSTDASGALIINEYTFTTVEDFKIISLVLDMMLILLKEHNIDWYENYEIICVQSTLVNLLKQNILPPKLQLQALSLIDWGIKHFLAPDLTLLVESKSGSSVKEIGSIIKSYMEHEEWEVRDSVMQILLSCIEVSFIKYVPLQKVISENNLVILVAKRAVNDPEPYVQAQAFKCLSAATRIESIWKDVLIAHPSLYTQVAYVVQYNPEGMVRKEATNVLVEAYVNKKVTDVFLPKIYILMGYAVLNDLHWEVQIVALHFWKQVIQTLLSSRGMLDGKFPSVTFSKEKRKIIVLNNTEILKQLIELMEHLSTIGCLAVLHECLNEDCDLRVLELAYSIANNLINILDNYKFDSIFKKDGNVSIVETMIDIETEVTNTIYDNRILSETSKSRDEVITHILSTNTGDLIEQICMNYMPLKFEKFDDIDDCPTINLKKISPQNFVVNFKNKDYPVLLKEKLNVNSRSLNYLLDEILNLDTSKMSITDSCY